MALTRSAGRAPEGGSSRHTRQSTRCLARLSPTPRYSRHSDNLSSDGSDESEEDIITISSDSDSEHSDYISAQSRPNRREQVPAHHPSNRPLGSSRRNSNNHNNMSHRDDSISRVTPRKAVAVTAERNHPKAKSKAKSSPRGASSASPSKQRQRQRQRQKPSDATSQSSAPVPVTPNWLDPRISYDCWVAIFLHAASERSTDSYASWLLDMALVCRAFTEPALKALYSYPMIRTPTKARRLASLLARNPSETYTNYRVKIEYLHIDIHIVPQTLFYPLIHPLPRLKELIIYTPTDQLPYRKLEPHGRWHYTESLFNAFIASSSESQHAALDKPWPTILKSWEWSGRLIGGHVANVDHIARIHQTPSFAHLTRLSFTNFQIPSLRYMTAVTTAGTDNSEDVLFIESVAHAISELKSLKHLAFESSTIVNDRLLSLLPQDLLHLDLINCWEITSEHLESYLQRHGRELQSLNLLHNQSLNLEFLTSLAVYCPNLRYFHMNMSYFRHHGSINDSSPMYDYSLLPSQRPQWPSTLRLLSIEHIRNWHEDTAVMFLESIAESSANLPDLRHLSIKTMLDIPWQARAELRKKWRAEMDRIFLRPIIPPHDRTSVRQCVAAEASQISQKRKRRSGIRAMSPSRRSGRIADFQSEKNQSLRHARQRRLTYREPDTDEDEFDVSSEEELSTSDASSNKKSRLTSEHHSKEPIVQGLCDTVTILFDNQKPTELQFGMDDFLDEEESEEEWDGADSEEDLSIAF